MKDRLLAALLTVIVFGAGFWAGKWQERTLPLPPPPAQYLGEFGGAKPSGPRPPVNRAQLAASIEAIKPQLEAFRTRTAEIDAQLESDILSILTPEQRVRHDEWAKRHGPPRPHNPADDEKPLTDEQIGQALQRPIDGLVSTVIITMPLDRLTQRLKLDDAQREKVRDLLRVHRDKFLELLDSAPPPSLMLSRLAPLTQRLGQPLAPANEH